ncbi:cell filamentation protein Fic [TM7 phylum sp. oral taxon 356]|nr:cell filamentation protein Fic [TM7 phylum sp. oral taxon 356]
MTENASANFLLYKTADNKVSINVQVRDETVWLTQEQMAELFDKSKKTISEHIRNVYLEGELTELATMRKSGNSGFSTKPTNYYNLDVIISVGYRVKSLRGTQFRQWATKRLREYIVKGFTMDDERLKQGGGRYFRELLQRIRDIRSSERNLYQQVTDIYATSIDYKKDAKLTRRFFATVQNKMHVAAHGKTAAELVYERADAKKPNMGLTNFKGDYITSDDVEVAKNYLSEEELNVLNLIVSQYLDFAELQATRQKAMTMQQWIDKLDEFLKISDSSVLAGAGKIKHEQAMVKAKREFKKYRDEEMRRLESDFDKAVKEVRTDNSNEA